VIFAVEVSGTLVGIKKARWQRGERLSDERV
jgi:hypothetical protein